MFLDVIMAGVQTAVFIDEIICFKKVLKGEKLIEAGIQML